MTDVKYMYRCAWKTYSFSTWKSLEIYVQVAFVMRCSTPCGGQCPTSKI